MTKGNNISNIVLAISILFAATVIVVGSLLALYDSGYIFTPKLTETVEELNQLSKYELYRRSNYFDCFSINLNKVELRNTLSKTYLEYCDTVTDLWHEKYKLDKEIEYREKDIH